MTSGLAATTDPNGRLCYTDLDLSGARFEDATLTRITFEGETHFDRCEFQGEVRFENCAFTGYVSFAGATAGRLAFRDTRFDRLVNLSGAAIAELSIRRSEFHAPVALELRTGDVDIHLTEFAGRPRLVGTPRRLNLRRVVFRGGAQFRMSGTEVLLHDVDFGAPSSLGPWTALSAERPRLTDVANTDLARLTVFSTDLSRCSFTGAHNLDGFGVDSLEAFAWTPPGPYTHRRVIWGEVRSRGWTHPGDDTREKAPGPGLIAGHYRALRKAREDAKDEPGAADFYYGEMEMRRIARRAELRDGETWGDRVTAATEYVLLWLYWGVSGYGLRAWRALTALVVVLLGASVIFRYAGFPGDTHTYAASLRFSVQSAMSLVRGTDEALTPTGEWAALALRLLGPLLFGLALLALRGRVRR